MSMDADEYQREKERVLRESETGYMNRKDRRRLERRQRIQAKKDSLPVRRMPSNARNSGQHVHRPV